MSGTIAGSQVTGPIDAAVGLALFQNTAVGTNTLAAVIAGGGSQNTASGQNALAADTTGSRNTANGAGALKRNTSGVNNTASGVTALSSNTSGSNNTASGFNALHNNTSGGGNTAIGVTALFANDTGSDNTAVGTNSLTANTSGGANTAIGQGALQSNTTGSNNIALGISAGTALTSGDFNIYIGNAGVATESNTIRIGNTSQTRTFISGISGVTPAGAALPVFIDSNGQLGTTGSISGTLISGAVANATTASSLSGTITGSQITGSITTATLPATQISAGTAAISISGNAATATTATTATNVAGSGVSGAITTATIGGTQITGTINAAQLPIGTTAGTVAAGNDGRLSDARAPLAGSANYIQNQSATPQTASFNINGNASIGGALDFGSSVRQMLNLFGTSFAIGVQNATQDYRSDANFAWFTAGTHVDTPAFSPGVGGSVLMTLTPAGIPTAVAVTGAARAQTFTSTSDRAAKTDFSPVDAREVLDRVALLPVTTWSYKNEGAVRHIGPVAQDFRAAFNLGYDDKSISVVDAQGVAFAAIQGLNQKLEAALKEKDAKIKQCRSRASKRLRRSRWKLRRSSSRPPGWPRRWRGLGIFTWQMSNLTRRIRNLAGGITRFATMTSILNIR